MANGSDRIRLASAFHPGDGRSGDGRGGGNGRGHRRPPAHLPLDGSIPADGEVTKWRDGNAASALFPMGGEREREREPTSKQTNIERKKNADNDAGNQQGKLKDLLIGSGKCRFIDSK